MLMLQKKWKRKSSKDWIATSKYNIGLHIQKENIQSVVCSFFRVRLAAHVSNGWKSLIHPSSGKDIAKTKGVLFIELLWLTWGESEGRWRQISGLTNRNHIRLQLRIRLHDKLKSNNYSELTVVNVADIWRERNVWYQGRSRQRMKTEYEIRQ